jgi:methylase of polypeptide subunit release factors
MIVTEFCGLRLQAEPGKVMTPRPATEALVATAVEHANVCRHGLGERVSVLRGDLLEGVPGGLDLVVANLPYLASHLRPLRPELAGEPPEAVFCEGDGLGNYRRLVEACRPMLRPEGLLAIQLHGRVLVSEAASLAVLDLAA